MVKENVSLAFRLKKIDGIRNCLLEEIKHNHLMTEKHKKCAEHRTTLNILLFSFQLTVDVFQFLFLLH